MFFLDVTDWLILFVIDFICEDKKYRHTSALALSIYLSLKNVRCACFQSIPLLYVARTS